MFVKKLNDIEIGLPFLHENSPSHDGFMMNLIHDPETLAMTGWFQDITNEELQELMFSDLEVKMFQENDKIIALFRVTESNWYFDVIIDPVWVKDQRFKESFRYNQVFPIIALDRKPNEASVVKGIRLVHFPSTLFSGYIQSWHEAAKNPNYDTEYYEWVNQLEEIEQLWQRATSVGTIRG